MAKSLLKKNRLITKVELIKELNAQIRQTSKALREMKGKGWDKSSLAFSSANALLRGARKMAKALREKPRTRKITKADISATSRLLEEARGGIEDDTRYFVQEEEENSNTMLEPWGEIDERLLYSIARELIEEGYGSTNAIPMVEEMRTRFYPITWDKEQIKQEMIRLINDYITDIKERQQQEREEFERGFNKGNTRF